MRFWTRQHEAILKELEDTGRYRVKKEYIAEKNGEITDFYLPLYEWYTNAARKYIHLEPELKYPIWLSISNELMLQPVEHAVILEVEIPDDSYLLCNYDAWGYRVNYFYVPKDDVDANRHQDELARYGIASEDALITTDKGNFYPLLKREIISSWDRVFEVTSDDPAMTVGTCWELKKEWIKDIQYYTES